MLLQSSWKLVVLFSAIVATVTAEFDPNVTISTLIEGLQQLAATADYAKQDWPTPCRVKPGSHYDFIVVGGGTAGLVLANRLTEDSTKRVLVVEAGGNPPITSVVPGLYSLLTHSEQDWDYYAEKDNRTSSGLNTQRVMHTRGKMLGGSSSLDHLVYERGTEYDYTHKGWEWESNLKYFKKLENMTDQRILSGPTSQYHCNKGPLGVEEHKVSDDFKEKEEIMLDLYKEIGMPTLLEANIPRPNGSSLVNFKISDKKRASTAQEYYLPIKDRKNLCVMTNTLALKVLFNYRNQAIGVRVQTRLGKFNVYANIEVILSAGVFNSPQLLMLSGIGPKNHLKAMGINVVVESPQVGKNLQDHLLVPIGISGKVDETDEPQPTLEALRTLPLPLIGGTFALDDGTPDLQHLTAHFGKLSAVFFMTLHYTFDWNLEISKSFILNYPDREMFYAMAFLAKPKSRGRVMLRSKNPQDPPRIYTGFLKEDEDLLKMVKAVKKLYSIKDSTYVQKAGGGFSRPPLSACDNLQFESDDYWKCYVKVMANTAFHAVGTCSIGSVVDESLQVNGVKNLRVVDDSVMEFIPCAKTGAVTIMIAEKAADIIKKKYGMTAGYRKFPCK